MENIPTAEEFFRNHSLIKGKYEEECFEDIPKVMIQFTKLHVKAALKKGYKNQGGSWTNSTSEETKCDLFIQNSYPLTNIK
jgi:hypothetical protein